MWSIVTGTQQKRKQIVKYGNSFLAVLIVWRRHDVDFSLVYKQNTSRIADK